VSRYITLPCSFRHFRVRIPANPAPPPSLPHSPNAPLSAQLNPNPMPPGPLPSVAPIASALASLQNSHPAPAPTAFSTAQHTTEATIVTGTTAHLHWVHCLFHPSSLTTLAAVWTSFTHRGSTSALFSFLLHCQRTSVLPEPHAQRARSPLSSFCLGREQCVPCARRRRGGAGGSAGAGRGRSLACPLALPEPHAQRARPSCICPDTNLSLLATSLRPSTST